MTKQNPRPRKYASDAEKMKAYRARAAEVCVRLEPKTMTTLDSIADEIGYTRNELMQSMVKFGLTNRDWRNEGLTAHKRLPRYQENPMATKPPSAAQLAARARFAEMARSGVLNRKRQIAAKKRAANPVKKSLAVSDETIYKRYRIVHGRGVYYITREGHNIGSATTLTEAKAIIDMLTEGQPNPRKKTVSQKISQLVHEGYPQRQAVAVALNEQRAGKVKRNPVGKEARLNLPSNFKYGVQIKGALGRVYDPAEGWKLQAVYKTKIEAKDYADALSNRYSDLEIRVVTFTGGRLPPL